MEIDIEKDKSKYELEIYNLSAELQQIEQRRALLIQAIQERNGIIAYLSSLKKEEKK